MSSMNTKNDKILRPVAVVVGTRPGIIKMCPIIKELSSRQIPHFVLHTGQHYSPEMDNVFIKELEIDSQVFRVEGTSEKVRHGEKTAHMIAGVESILVDQNPIAVMVCGDADTNLAAGLAARKLHILLGHVESGLRSFDWKMPEEHNRVILDHISEMLFAPTQDCVKNLEKENVKGQIYLTGNTVVDALYHSIEISKNCSTILDTLSLTAKEYALITTHREENVDDKAKLIGIFNGIRLVLKKIKITVVFPIHPRTIKMISTFNLNSELKSLVKDGLVVTEPLGYLDFLNIMQSSRVILTDSGGIQEEACILKVPTVTLRENTERPETLIDGQNRLAGTDPESIYKHTLAALQIDLKDLKSHPFGDGRAASRMVDILLEKMEKVQ